MIDPDRHFSRLIDRTFRCINRTLLLLLVLTVFGWGTGYKLSLYHPDSAHRATPAKLSTRASEIAKNELERASSGTLVDQTLPVWDALVVSITVPRISAERDYPPDSLQKASSFSISSALYLRPPPARQRSVV
jgi:hypothetical protein